MKNKFWIVDMPKYSMFVFIAFLDPTRSTEVRPNKCTFRRLVKHYKLFLMGYIYVVIQVDFCGQAGKYAVIRLFI